MLQEAFEYPRRGESSLVTILIGGACVLFSFLVVPAVLLQGYVLRVLRQGGRGDPPTFDDPAGLLVDGLKALVVQLVYVGVPTLLMVVVPAVLGTFVLALGSTAGTGGGGGAGALGVVGALVALVFAFLLGIFVLFYAQVSAYFIVARSVDDALARA